MLELSRSDLLVTYSPLPSLLVEVYFGDQTVFAHPCLPHAQSRSPASSLSSKNLFPGRSMIPSSNDANMPIVLRYATYLLQYSWLLVIPT